MVSFACGFCSPTSERAELVHTWNARLRRLGLSPAPPGSSELGDRVKAAMVNGRRRLEPLRLKAVSRIRPR
jgi:hypothetical protein